MKRIWVSMLLAAAMLAVGVNAVSARQQRPAATVSYVVKPGDTLWRIAKGVSTAGDIRASVHELIEANDLTTPSLRVGQVLQLPAPRP